jgi:dihydroneopterin aldolase
MGNFDKKGCDFFGFFGFVDEKKHVLQHVFVNIN